MSLEHKQVAITAAAGSREAPDMEIAEQIWELVDHMLGDGRSPQTLDLNRPWPDLRAQLEGALQWLAPARDVQGIGATPLSS